MDKKKNFVVVCQSKKDNNGNFAVGASFFETEEKAKSYFERAKNFGFVALAIGSVSLIIEVPGHNSAYWYCLDKVEFQKAASVGYYDSGINNLLCEVANFYESKKEIISFVRNGSERFYKLVV